MQDTEQPSERLVMQRLRNRVIEALETFGDGAAGVRQVGTVEYVEQFFDIIDERSPWNWRRWSCFTADEVIALDEVHALLVATCDATPGIVDDDAFIETGWPVRIQPPAARALKLLRDRGRFSEDHEEDEPSVRR
ncbi:hypothetical protein WEH80_23990 [Actinomycetes bacterium KLBMP 9759]